MQAQITMRHIDTDQIEERIIEGANIFDAMQEALWTYGEEYWIVAVEFLDPPSDWDGRWVLTDTRGFGDVKYASKEEAMADADHGVEILIAMPNKG